MNEDDIENKPGTSDSSGIDGSRGRVGLEKQDINKDDKNDDQPNAGEREDTKHMDQNKIYIQRFFSFFLIRKVPKCRAQF